MTLITFISLEKLGEAYPGCRRFFSFASSRKGKRNPLVPRVGEAKTPEKKENRRVNTGAEALPPVSARPLFYHEFSLWLIVGVPKLESFTGITTDLQWKQTRHYIPKLHLHRSFLDCRPSRPPYTHIPPAPTAAEWLYRGLGPSPFHLILIHFELSTQTKTYMLLLVIQRTAVFITDNLVPMESPWERGCKTVHPLSRKDWGETPNNRVI